MNKRILVVDDQESMRQMLSDLIEMMGYVPLTVSGGQAALAVLETSQFDLVITGPSPIMPSASVATTSALTGPPTTWHSRVSVSWAPSAALASSDGFVVIPSMIPSGMSASTAATLAESTNSFMVALAFSPTGPR